MVKWRQVNKTWVFPPQITHEERRRHRRRRGRGEGRGKRGREGEKREEGGTKSPTSLTVCLAI